VRRTRLRSIPSPCRLHCAACTEVSTSTAQPALGVLNLHCPRSPSARCAALFSDATDEPSGALQPPRCAARRALPFVSARACQPSLRPGFKTGQMRAFAVDACAAMPNPSLAACLLAAEGGGGGPMTRPPRRPSIGHEQTAAWRAMESCRPLFRIEISRRHRRESAHMWHVLYLSCWPDQGEAVLTDREPSRL
jgi:hypothetical protein